MIFLQGESGDIRQEHLDTGKLMGVTLCDVLYDYHAIEKEVSDINDFMNRSELRNKNGIMELYNRRHTS